MAARVKTFTYHTSIEWKSGVEGTLSAPHKPEIGISTPPEFKGPEGNWTPENLLVGAVESCLLFTFLSLAKSRKLEFVAYASHAEGLLEPVFDKLVISKVTVRPRIEVATEEDAEKARRIMGQVEEQCFISNSIESDVIIEPEIVVTAAIPAKAGDKAKA